MCTILSPELREIEIQMFGLPAVYFTGDSYGQSKEACYDSQESLET